MGEVVPLELSFTSSSAKKYQINMATYDRSGRMSYEQFKAEPESGWSDPLRSYFGSIGGWLGGGLTSYRFLSEVPTTISLELNEWVRFDRPGNYRLYLESRRVSEIGQDSPPFGREKEALTSNELQLTIAPATKEWQEQTLRQALATLDLASPSGPMVTPKPEQADTLRTALKTLRYLGTAAAAKELARRLQGKDNNADVEFMFGLIGSPQRETALSEMQRLQSNPDHPVTAMFLLTMSVLSIDPGQPPRIMRAQRQEYERKILAQLLADLPEKHGRALAISLDGVLQRIGLERTLPKEEVRRLAVQLADVFDQLPTEKQARILQYRWDLIKSPSLLPLLRRYAQKYQDFPIQNEWNAYNAIRLSGAALQRWYELVPDEARPAVIQEILRPKPRFDAKTLGILPDKTLPEVEQTLMEHFVASENLDGSANLASLIHRYATSTILPRMLSIIDRHLGKWACAIQEPALAYLLRVDRAVARPRIEAAMATRGEGYSACNHILLLNLGAVQFDPLLEEIALRSLYDDDPEVAGNAAEFLGRYGSATAEARLWERFTKWSGEWHGRESELRYLPGESSPNIWQAGLGQNLAKSLATGEGWLSDETKLQRILQLSVGPLMRQQGEQFLSMWQRKPWRIVCYGGVPKQCDVAQYNLHSLESLKKKLAQFPLGSVFLWHEATGPVAPKRENVFRELSQFLAEHGMALQKSRKP